MPWARAEVRSWVRSGVARESHSGVPLGAAMTYTFMPCLRCFCEEYGSSARTRSVGIRLPSTMTWSPSPRPVRASCRPGAQEARMSTVSSNVPPGGCLGYPETGSELSEFLILPQMDESKQRLLEATELAPTGVHSRTVLVQQPRDVRVRDVDQQGPSVASVLSGITTRTTRGPVSSPHPLTSPFHPPAQDERGLVVTTRCRRFFE